MAKAVSDNGKREKIVDAAMKLFFERGYEGTSVRMIQREVGNEPGLFYYYFKSKDEVLDAVLDRFCARYGAELDAAAENGKREPEAMLERLFEYIRKEAELFRMEYAGRLHRSALGVIRERFMKILEPYFLDAVRACKQSGRISADGNDEVTAVILAHGAAAAFFHEEERVYGAVAEIMRAAQLLTGAGSAPEPSEMFKPSEQPQMSEMSDRSELSELPEMQEVTEPEPERPAEKPEKPEKAYPVWLL